MEIGLDFQFEFKRENLHAFKLYWQFFDTFQNDKKILSIGRTLTRLTSIKMKNERCFKERRKIYWI